MTALATATKKLSYVEACFAVSTGICDLWPVCLPAIQVHSAWPSLRGRCNKYRWCFIHPLRKKRLVLRSSSPYDQDQHLSLYTPLNASSKKTNSVKKEQQNEKDLHNQIPINTVF